MTTSVAWLFGFGLYAETGFSASFQRHNIYGGVPAFGRNPGVSVVPFGTFSPLETTTVGVEVIYEQDGEEKRTYMGCDSISNYLGREIDCDMTSDGVHALTNELAAKLDKEQNDFVPDACTLRGMCPVGSRRRMMDLAAAATVGGVRAYEDPVVGTGEMAGINMLGKGFRYGESTKWFQVCQVEAQGRDKRIGNTVYSVPNNVEVEYQGDQREMPFVPYTVDTAADFDAKYFQWEAYMAEEYTYISSTQSPITAKMSQDAKQFMQDNSRNPSKRPFVSYSNFKVRSYTSIMANQCQPGQQLQQRFEDLPDTFDEGNKENWFNFLNDFGTHYIFGLTAGALKEELMLTVVSKRDNSLITDVSTIFDYVSGKATNILGDWGKDRDETEVETKDTWLVDTSFYSYSNGAFDEDQPGATTISEPAVISVFLQPIYTIVLQSPEFGQNEGKTAALKQAWLEYMDNSFGCVDNVNAPDFKAHATIARPCQFPYEVCYRHVHSQEEPSPYSVWQSYYKKVGYMSVVQSNTRDKCLMSVQCPNGEYWSNNQQWNVNEAFPLTPRSDSQTVEIIGYETHVWFQGDTKQCSDVGHCHLKWAPRTPMEYTANAKDYGCVAIYDTFQ